MTDQERDDLLRAIAHKQDEQGRALAEQGRALERIEQTLAEHGATLQDHGSALRAHLEQLHAIRVVLTGDRAQHYQLEQRVTDLERRAG